jgi:hypothetical protein
VPFSAREIKLMLEAAPSLEELSFQMVDALDDSVLQGFLPPTNACMKLHTLKIQECRNFSGAVLKQLIYARNSDAEDENVLIKRLVLKYCGLDDSFEDVFKDRVPEFIWGTEDEDDDSDVEVVEDDDDDN